MLSRLRSSQCLNKVRLEFYYLKKNKKIPELMNGFFRKPSCIKYEIVNISEWAQMNRLIDSYGPCSLSGDAELHSAVLSEKPFMLQIQPIKLRKLVLIRYYINSDILMGVCLAK